MSVQIFVFVAIILLLAELRSTLDRISLVTAEMVHYVNQVQYYILFEVIECAFENFAKQFLAATTIEEVIRDHDLFLSEIRSKTLKDDSPASEVINIFCKDCTLSAELSFNTCVSKSSSASCGLRSYPSALLVTKPLFGQRRALFPQWPITSVRH